MVAVARRKQIQGAPRSSRIAMRPPDGADRGTGRSRGAFERELRRLERLCESLRERSEESTFSQTELLRTFSHDLRQPLGLILLSAQMLPRTLPADQPSRRYVHQIARAAEEINHMLEDFADAGAIQSGRFSVECSPHEVEPMIEEAISVVRLYAEPKGIEISVDIEEGMPAVFCDRDRIGKVLANLLNSAIRFTPKNGSVAIHVELEDDFVRFSVTDSGPGIPRDRRPFVFTCPAGPQRPVVQGASIASYVAKGVVEAHGGHLSFESEVGRGTKFYFTLPAATMEASD